MKTLYRIWIVTILTVCMMPLHGTEDLAKKSLSLEDLKNLGFTPLKLNGVELEAKANGLENKFIERVQLNKFFEQIGMKYETMKYDSASDILVKRKIFSFRGCFWHVREFNSGNNDSKNSKRENFKVLVLLDK